MDFDMDCSCESKGPGPGENIMEWESGVCVGNVTNTSAEQNCLEGKQ